MRGVLLEAARQRPVRLDAAIRVAMDRLGEPVRFGERLADLFLHVAEHGNPADRARLFRGLLLLQPLAEGSATGGDQDQDAKP